MKQFLQKRGFLIAFVLAFFTLSYCYDYFTVLNQPADGIHVWRQTDGLSMALKYYEEGNGLFEPKMHNQLNDEGMAAGEFPLMYYLVGKLYHVFGEQHWVYRGLWWMISFVGFFFLFRFCSRFLKNEFWGLLISLFTFTSPILIIYGFSFVSDPIALFFTFIAWYTIHEYYLQRKQKWLWISVVLVSLAATFKITSLISIFAIILVFGVNLLLKRIRWQIRSKDFFIRLIPIAVGGVLVFAWYYYASYYNKLHNTTYFFLKAAPIWELSSEELTTITDQIIGWSREYFYETGRHVLYAFAFLVILPVFNRSFQRIHYWLYLLCFLGFLAFSLLFYSQFSHHDYYVVNLVFIVPVTVLFFVKKYEFLLKKNKYVQLGFQVLFGTLLIASVMHATTRSNERFKLRTEWLDLDLYEFRDHIEEYGISKNDLVLVPHDPSPNITLHALNMNGWSQLNSLLIPKEFNSKIEAGAKWMIVSDERFYDHPVIEPYKDRLVVDYKGIRVYRLTN